jgi:hypothetical protein
VNGGGAHQTQHAMMAQSHDLDQEEDIESYEHLYDQDKEEEKLNVGENGVDVNGSGAAQQDTSFAIKAYADGALNQGDQTMATAGPHAGGHHHGKPKYQKIPPEKYAHITYHHLLRLTLNLIYLET